MKFTVDEDMARFVQEYLDIVRQEVGEDGKLYTEHRVDLSRLYGEEGGGTVDALILNPHSIAVIDLKYGKGVAVSAVGNTQLRIYAAGAYLFAKSQGFDPQSVKLMIVQPRVSGGVSEEVLTIEELNAWVRDVLVPGAKATRENTDALVPSDKGCMWCKAKAICPALAAKAFAVIENVQQPPAPVDMTPEKLALALDNKKLIESWLKACEAEGKRRLETGSDLPGYKLVRGKPGNRTWVEGQTDAIVSVLVNNYGLDANTIHSHELLSAPQMLKLQAVKDMGDELLQPFIARSEGAICLAPASDKREAVSPLLAAEEVFAQF